MPLVDPFDVPADSSGATLVDPFDAKPVDYSKLGEFDATEATESQKWRIALGYLTTTDSKARADILRKVLPGATVLDDPNNGRPIVTYKGETGYIDKPGVTLGGVLDSIAAVGKYIPAGRYAAGGANILTQVGRAFVGGAATSVAEDVAAIPQGSEQGVDPVKAGVAGVATAAGQAASVPIGKGVSWLGNKGVELWKAMRGNQQVVTATGALTAAGRKLAEKAGLDPDAITPQLAEQLEAAAKRATGAGVEDLPGATKREALSRRFDVPLTRGELTGDYAEQSLEESLRRMDVTTKAGRIMRDQEERSADALRGASGDSGYGLLKREMARKGEGVTDVSDAGQRVITDTTKVAAKDRAAYGEAYKTARESGAALDIEHYGNFVNNAEAVLKDSIDYDPNLYPQTAKVLDNLRARAAWVSAEGKPGQAIPLRKLENLRKIINTEWQSANATDRMGLDVLRNQFDEMVNGALDSGRVTGDKAGIQAWKAGRELYGRFQELYAPSKAAGTAEQKAGRTVQNWIKSDNVTGDEVIRDVVSNKALTERILTINGKGSPAHIALKQGVLEYVFRPALKGDGISPRLVVAQFERFFKGANAEQMRTIYSPKEIAAIREFAELSKAKIPLQGVVNFSNTGNVLVKTLQQLGSRLGLIAATGHMETAAALGAFNAAAGMRSTSQARSAIQGLVPVTRGAAAVPAIAGAAGDEIDE